MGIKGTKVHPILYVFLALLLITPVVAFISYFAHLCPFLAKSTPVIRTSLGKVQGTIGYSLRSGKEFWQFLGISYAEPPVGRLRFEPPIPITKPWDDVKQVIKYPPRCFQFEVMGQQNIQGAEDCLFLNVFVSTPKDKLFLNHTRPVLVYIHGGGFLSSGARTYRPDFLMDQDDLVLVTMNYRLGPFGFLNLAEPDNYNSSNIHLPRGNMGLKDQLLVLKWVQKNIAFFGGDPKKVLIFGESAGAVSVHLHMLTPKSRGLFRKAISFSGTALNPWSVHKDLRKISMKLTKSIGCPLGDKIETMECLHNADAEKMVRLQKVMPDPTHENDWLVPSVEVVKLNDTFLEDYPIDLIRKGEYPVIPWILGVNSGEGIVVTARVAKIPDSAKIFEKLWLSKVAYFGAFPTDEVSLDIADKVRRFYVGNKTLSSVDTEPFLHAVTKLTSDTLFYRGHHQAAVEHARHGAPTYLFYFNYTSAVIPSIYSVFTAVTPNDWLPAKLKILSSVAWEWIVEKVYGSNKSSRRFGISHVEDLVQLWNIEGLSGYFMSGDKEFSSAFVKFIVQFARDDEKAPLEFRGTPWPALSPLDVMNGEKYLPLPTMHMNNSETPNMILEPYAESLKFWGSFDK